ncbi:MAG: GNAT family N-acetyltransferase [Actinobacteria bacterium]|nr:GNAT family N-acetyltransferase [Actinomycetota bacterium]
MTKPGSSFDAQRCTLTVTNNLARLPMVQAFVREYASGAGFPAQDLRRLDLLMEEAVTNVVHGAFAADERASFDIVCERVPAGMQISVHDEGLPYDPSLTPEYDPDAALDSQTGAGLGSFLMQQIADRVEFHNLGSRGKETVFVKYLETASVTSAPPAEEAPPGEPQPVPKAERVALEVGPLRPEQAIEVCRCIYDAYRYTYVNEHMYYPDRVVALNQSGDMISAVACTREGEVAGHAALVFPDETREIADLASVATKVRFRGQAIARRLGEYLSQEALARGLAGLFIEEVTAHTFTQKFCHRLGFGDCAFLLGYSPATMAFKGIAEETAARRSVIVGFKYLQPPAPTLVHAPARHHDMIARIYESLGAPATFAGAGEAVAAAGVPAASVLHVTVNTSRSVATIRPDAYGRDLERRLHDEMYRLRRDDVKVMDVYLNLGTAGTDVVAQALEESGFVFTGLVPGGPSGDWLVLQYFNGVMVDYDAIQVEAGFTRELLAYIRGNDPYAG